MKILIAAAAFAVATALTVHVHASTWKKLSPTTSPSARAYPTMAYDPTSNRVVLFGGSGTNGNLNDTWAFDGTTWTQLTTALAPPARAAASMAFDRVTNKLVMFGGFDAGQYLQDTWVWDGATSTWTQAQMKSLPPKATGAMLFTDPISGRAMMFGGYNSSYRSPFFYITWRWTGTNWRKLHPITVPNGRASGVATTDPAKKETVLTGGAGGSRTDNTWTWDGHNWFQQFPATQVQALQSPGSAFDPDVQAVVVFGGFGQNGDTNGTWSWSGTDWVQLIPTNSPSARAGLGMAYDPATHQTIIFGGQLSNGKLVNQTWKLVGG